MPELIWDGKYNASGRLTGPLEYGSRSKRWKRSTNLRRNVSAAEFGDTAAARTQSYRSFILDLFHAAPMAGHAWLHGLKNGRMVHVGTADAPVTNGDVKQIVAEFRKVVGTGKDGPSTRGVDILCWDFAFELNEIARHLSLL